MKDKKYTLKGAVHPKDVRSFGIVELCSIMESEHNVDIVTEKPCKSQWKKWAGEQERREEAAHDYNFVWRILSWTAGPTYKRADFQILSKSRDSWQLNQAVRKLEIFTCSVSVKCEALLKVAVVLWEVWRRCNKQNSGCLLLVTPNSDYKKYIWKVPASPSLFPVCYIQ